VADTLSVPRPRPRLADLRDGALAAFFVALSFSISLSQVLLAALVVMLPAWSVARGAGRAGGAGIGRSLWVELEALRRHPLTRPFLVFSALTLLSALLSGDAAGSLWVARDLLRIATFYVVLASIRDASHAERAWTGFLIGVTVMAVYGLGQVYLCGQQPTPLPDALVAHVCPHRSRASGPFSIYMTFGGVLLLGALFFVAYLAHVAWRRVWWMVPAGAVTVAALAVTFSRNAWLGFAAGTLGLVGTARRGRRAVLVVVVAAVLAAAFSADGVMARVRSIANPEDATIRDRVAMWRSGLAMIADHPLLGVGPGQVRVWYPHYRRPEAVRASTGHLHNSPIQIAAERGLPALGVWIWLWVLFFHEGALVLGRIGGERVTERALVAASLWGVGGFLVAGLFEHNFGDGEVVMPVYALMAIPWIVARALPPAPPPAA
jgi:O-antigen ligase